MAIAVTCIEVSAGAKLLLYANDMLLYKPLDADHSYGVRDLQKDIVYCDGYVTTSYLSFKVNRWYNILSQNGTSLFIILYGLVIHILKK